MSDWQTIDTAPRDGRSVLIFALTHISDIGRQMVAWWNKVDEKWTFHVDNEQVLFAHTPTHWMPLPAPPHSPE